MLVKRYYRFRFVNLQYLCPFENIIRNIEKFAKYVEISIKDK